MEKNFDVTTLFRMVIPGYIFLLVLFSFKPELFLNLNVHPVLLTLAGIPIGFASQTIWRFIFFLLCLEDNLTESDREYIANEKGIRMEGDEQKSDFTEQDNFYYSASIDYLLLTTDKLKELNSHIRFLYTRMYSSGSVIISIIGGIALFISTFWDKSFSNIFWWIAIFWIVLVVALVYIICKTMDRILWWRHLVAYTNSQELRKNLGK